MTDPLLDLLGTGRAHGGERARFLVGPRYLTLLPRLADLCATDARALPIAAQVLAWIEAGATSFDRVDPDVLRSFAGAVGRAALRHGGEAGVLALFRVHALEYFGPYEPITEELGEELLSSPDPELRLAAAVCSGGDDDVFREFLARESTGDTERSVIRRTMDGRPQQIPMFAAAITTGAPIARWHNIGQCRRIIDTWRAAPPQLVPVLAGCLTDGPMPVRSAAAGALRMAGEVTREHLDLISEFFRETGNAQALATLVAFQRPEAVAPLRDFLAAPHGNGSVQELLAEAAWCAAEIAGDMAVHLRAEAVDDPHRRLAATLNALRNWGPAAAPLIPALAALHTNGVARTQVMEILAGIGPSVVTVEELLLNEARDKTIDGVRRSHAAAALLRCGSAVDEAAAVLLAEFDHPAAQQHLATLDPAPDIPRHLAGAAIPAYRARILWLSGDRDPQLAADLMRRVGPLPGGLRALGWLAETGDLIEPHRPALAALRDDPGRPRSSLGSFRVRSDERLHRALTDLRLG
ncbi:hypothetical protein [Actinoplanes derwentensis]|uniref:HEAT repeat-containing protein n=1 Tax=Actinoplanes derwentensis TaxID=113562 RepID=A0A1H2D6L6_9ACTN|nr:hypothetical protein [Actinoplanes derwentensis]SDT78383.1 hypothetical protein SAMN04489716_8349 [Actinoplanes derwentensis]